MSVARPSKTYAWAPTWESGRDLGWLLIAAAGTSVVVVLAELDRALTATTVTAPLSDSGRRA